MPLDKSIQKVLVIGSGPIVIGQAAEFDYAGAQACRVLKDAGINVVLCNSNPATIMTDQAMADEIYLEPLTVETVKRIIKKERPDSILAGLGGQTGLTLAMQLDKEGFLQAQGVRLLGTDAAAISRAEDRELFKEAMAEIGQPVIASDIAETVDQAMAVAEKIGYPVIVRPAFTLGGAGGGAAKDPDELKIIAGTGLDASPITQILVEKAIFGWKEIEFETMRDSVGNVIAVCSMENLDPVGVHTGDSIVVAPTQTLADKEFQMLRKASLDIITHLGIVGGCNVQLALNPESFEYAVIEVNPRVSRSSALASKATGYPIAKITTKIALGYTLDEIKNDITGKTCACFEPTLDYIVVKMPKWPFDKFADASRALGTQMKATGEVMAIAPSFEMALLKAVRGAEIGMDTLNRKPDHGDDAPIRERLRRVDDHRLFTVFEALKSGVTVEEIHDITRIDPWFLCKLRKLAAFEASIADGLSEAQYREGKRLGYPDEALRRLSGGGELPEHRDAVYKMVDTCGAEFDAETPYFYSTYDRFCESRAFPRSGKPVIMVLGSGPIRIGQGIEFDYSSVHCVWTLKELGYDGVEWRVAEMPEKEPENVPFALRYWACNKSTLELRSIEAEAAKAKALCDEAGLEIFGLTTYLATNELEPLTRVFHAARSIGCRQVRVGLVPYNPAKADAPYPVLFARMREDLKAIDALAAETGVKAVLEIHMDTLLSSPSAAYRALEGFDPAHIGLIFDPGNMVNEGFEDYQKSFELLGDYIAHIHIKNGILAPDGEDELGACKWKRVWTPLKKGMADLKKLFAVARKAGYDGTFSIEDFSNDEATPDKLRENIAYLKALAASAQVPAPEQEESAFERLARPERSKP